MPATERYQTDVFAIIVVVASIAVLVFLIVAAIYFNGIQNWTTIPGSGESTFLFWAAIVLGVIFLGIVIYGLYRIFTHRAVICPKIRTRRVAVATPVPVSASTSNIVHPIPSATIPVANSVKSESTVVVTSKPESNVVKPVAPIPVANTGSPYPRPTVTSSVGSPYPRPTVISPVVSSVKSPATSSTQTSLQKELLDLASEMNE